MSFMLRERPSFSTNFTFSAGCWNHRPYIPGNSYLWIPLKPGRTDRAPLVTSVRFFLPRNPGPFRRTFWCHFIERLLTKKSEGVAKAYHEQQSSSFGIHRLRYGHYSHRLKIHISRQCILHSRDEVAPILDCSNPKKSEDLGWYTQHSSRRIANCSSYDSHLEGESLGRMDTALDG